MGLFSKLFKGQQKSVAEIKITSNFTNTNAPEKMFIAEGEPPFEYSEEQKTVAFLDWCDKTKSGIYSNSEYPQWFNYTLHISPSSFHKRMVAEGYLKPCAANIALEKMKVAELKEILQNNGLEAKGKKAALIETIMSSVDIRSLNLPVYYELSDKGAELLNRPESKELLTARSNRYGITLEEYYFIRKQYNNNVLPRDVMWRVLNEKQLLDTRNGNYGWVRNTYLHQAYMLEDEQRFLLALEHFIETAYFDLSGCENHNEIMPKEQAKIAPALIEYIQKYSSFYTDEIIERCARIYLPHHYYSIDEFAKIIRSIVDETDYYTQFIM